MGDSRKVRWGVLGTARIGVGSVIPAIQQSTNAEVVAIASRDERKAGEYARKMSIPNAYGSYGELLESDTIDAVYVPLPNGLHHDWTIAAAENGKHVLCEKPLALNTRECEEMIFSCQKNHVLLLEGYMYRFSPQIVKLNQLVRGGDIGKVSIVRSEFTYPPDDANDIRWKKELGGGALYDLGCYCVDFTRLIVGSEPITARAAARFTSRGGVDDVLVGVLQFPGKEIGIFDCGFQTGLRHSVEIIGDAGILRSPSAFEPGFQPQISKQRGKEMASIACEVGNPYRLMVEHFSDCILTNKEPRYTTDDSLNNMRTLDMLYRSASEHETP